MICENNTCLCNENDKYDWNCTVWRDMPSIENCKQRKKYLDTLQLKIMEGYREGHIEGFAQGYISGYAEGYSDGNINRKEK